MSGYDLPLEAPTTIGTSIDRAPLWLFETDDFSKDDFSKELSNDGPPPSSPWLRHDWSAVLSNLETRPSVDFLFNDPASEPAASTPSDGQPTFRGQFGFGPWRTVKPPTPENWRLLDLERLPSQLEELIL